MKSTGKKMEQIQNRILKSIDTYEQNMMAQTPPLKQIKSWQETKSRLKSGIQEIIDFAQPPYALYKYSLPVILIATPEIVYLPQNMGTLANVITTGDGGGLADISAALVTELDRQGVNVHVTLPEYKNLFKDLAHITNREYETLSRHMDDQARIYTITDDIFKVAEKVYDDSSAGLDKINLRRANAFMRGIISRLLPRLKGQYKHILVHCNDWMTGLVPPAARGMRIRSLMTFHNIFTMHQQPSGLRKHSIDIQPFWRHLIIEKKEAQKYGSYQRIINQNPYVDFMCSGLHAADYINTVSRTFLKEVVEGYFVEHNIMSEIMREIIIRRHKEGHATGIRNAPLSTADPRKDQALIQNYWFEEDAEAGIASVGIGKKANKNHFQKAMHLDQDPDVPIFFWPSRIARPQKGFDLLLEVIPAIMKEHEHVPLQIAVVANGETELIEKIKAFGKSFPGRVSYRPFDRDLGQIGIAGSDFILMPSLYEPCGTPQVVGQLYGTPPVVRKTGGLADTVKHLSHNGIDGNGFVFEDFIAEGFIFGIREAMNFYRKGEAFRIHVLERIMKEADKQFSIKDTARKYIEVYTEIFEKSGQKVNVV